MKITIKINEATYAIYIDGISMQAEYIYMGKDKDGNAKEQATTIGYYGPGQVDLAVGRIISEELSRNQDVVHLRRFLEVYKGIHEIIAPQLVELKQAIKEHRLEQTI